MPSEKPPRYDYSPSAPTPVRGCSGLQPVIERHSKSVVQQLHRTPTPPISEDRAPRQTRRHSVNGGGANFR